MSLRTPAVARLIPASTTSALYMTVQVAPSTTISPATIHTVKSYERSPRTPSKAPRGRSHHTTSRTPPTVYATRSGTPRARTTGTRPAITIETPSRNGVAWLEDVPATATTTPRTTTAEPRSQRTRRVRRTGGVGRLRMAVTMSRTLTRQAETATTARVSTTPSP
ncbi:MAG: hypothetical protein M5U14_21750 [Acidimicrobiia bacterium]|nr:hypothetical protein [Acidimicrobiia bacterium]